MIIPILVSLQFDLLGLTKLGKLICPNNTILTFNEHQLSIYRQKDSSLLDLTLTAKIIEQATPFMIDNHFQNGPSWVVRIIKRTTNS